MEEARFFTFTKTTDGYTVVKNGWPSVDIAPATSLSRAALFALNWATGGCAGQLDTEDIFSFLDPAIHGSYHGVPDGFVNSPDINTALMVFEHKPSEVELRTKADQVFAFIDTYRHSILTSKMILSATEKREVVA